MFSSAPNRISATTRFCAVYGHPIRHSASPAMQNAGIEALGLNWRYLAFEVKPEELGPALAGAKAMRFIGVNLTVPHKILALELADAVDKRAREWGAVNTICFETKRGNEWIPLGQVDPEEINEIRSHGFNTDADALIRALQEDLSFAVPGKSVLLLGAGGAGRVAALRLAAERARKIYLVNRTQAKAEEVAREIGEKFRDTEAQVGWPKDEVDLILNATSVGLKADDPLPIDLEAFPFKKAAAAYDMIYRPSETQFLRRAAEAGIRAANGLGMLLYQGTAALEIWTGKSAPVKEMRRALEENVYGKAARELFK